MILKCTADRVSVEADEQGYELWIETDEGDHITVNIHACTLDFYASVQKEIRPYVLEAESARATYVPSEELLSINDGYALDDPKHPTYHERMVGDA